MIAAAPRAHGPGNSDGTSTHTGTGAATGTGTIGTLRPRTPPPVLSTSAGALSAAALPVVRTDVSDPLVRPLLRGGCRQPPASQMW